MSGHCKVHISIHFLEKIPEAKKYIIDFFVHILIAFENTIRLSVHILIASAHALIVLENRISFSTYSLILSAHTLIASTPFCNVAFSPTVPSGDTPCLTAGDARRVNPWING